jgi:hypothetical protein
MYAIENLGIKPIAAFEAVRHLNEYDLRPTSNRSVYRRGIWLLLSTQGAYHPRLGIRIGVSPDRFQNFIGAERLLGMQQPADSQPQDDGEQNSITNVCRPLFDATIQSALLVPSLQRHASASFEGCIA